MRITKISGMGTEIINCINERSTLVATIDNTKQALKYARHCIKNKKIAGNELEEYGLNCLLQEYKQLLTVKSLAEKFLVLRGEDYYKLKHDCERLLKI